MNARRLFGTSGIRGVVNKDLSLDLCHRVGLAMGTTLSPSSKVCIATDTRISRDVIKEAVCTGLLSCSIDVADLGILPTPALALLTRELGFAAGIMVTASHNPPEFNGIKLFTGNSLGYGEAQEKEIEKIYFEQRFREGKQGTLTQAGDMRQEYLSFIKSNLSLPKSSRHLKIVVDPGNGAASGFAGDIFARMSLDVIPLNDEPDGSFPGRSPEPKADTLQGTIDSLNNTMPIWPSALTATPTASSSATKKAFSVSTSPSPSSRDWQSRRQGRKRLPPLWRPALFSIWR
jgi:phosphoglucosamine mutase